jgi:hypothetical protein
LSPQVRQNAGKETITTTGEKTMTKIVTLEEIADMLDGMIHRDPEADVGFDMRRTHGERRSSNHPCGTACCIGGWVQHLNPHTRGQGVAGAVMDVSGMSSATAYKLCYGVMSDNITPQQGAQAIRNALNYNDPRWGDVLTDE